MYNPFESDFEDI